MMIYYYIRSKWRHFFSSLPQRTWRLTGSMRNETHPPCVLCARHSHMRGWDARRSTRHLACKSSGMMASRSHLSLRGQKSSPKPLAYEFFFLFLILPGSTCDRLCFRFRFFFWLSPRPFWFPFPARVHRLCRTTDRMFLETKCTCSDARSLGWFVPLFFFLFFVVCASPDSDVF
jgi:hypothetical protein